jgi:hypothetical protein
LIEIAFGTVNLKSLRIIRIFRPLKTINTIKSRRLFIFIVIYRYEESDSSVDKLHSCFRKCSCFFDIPFLIVCHHRSSLVQWCLLQCLSIEPGAGLTRFLASRHHRWQSLYHVRAWCLHLPIRPLLQEPFGQPDLQLSQ